MATASVPVSGMARRAGPASSASFTRPPGCFSAPNWPLIGGSLPQGLSSTCGGGAMRPRQLVVEMNRGAHAFLPVAEMETLVFGVSVAGRVLDARQQARGAREEIRKGLHEADRAPGAHEDG